MKFLFLFFPKIIKLNISLIYKAIIIFFSVSLPMLNIYKFCKKEIFDLTTWRTSRTTAMWSSNQKDWAKKFHQTQNYRKGRYTQAHFWEICKKVQNEVTKTEKRSFWLIYPKTFKKFTFLGPVTSILNFLQFSQKCKREYRPFRSVCLLWNFL